MSNLKPVSRVQIIKMLALFCEKETISRDDILQQLNCARSSFYEYLKILRIDFKIECVGSIGGNAYYTIDKKTVKKYFNL